MLIVEDHELLAQSLSVTLGAEGIEAAVSSGPTREAVLATVDEQDPDLVLLDLDLGAKLGNGLEILPHLTARETLVVMLTGSDDRIRHAECVEAGAQGVLRKSMPFEALVDAIGRALEQGTLLAPGERDDLLGLLRAHRAAAEERLAPFAALTQRERDVLAALMEGRSAEEIANESVVALSTVRSQIRGVLTKLDVSSQLSAVALARRAGWQPDQAG